MSEITRSEAEQLARFWLEQAAQSIEEGERFNRSLGTTVDAVVSSVDRAQHFRELAEEMPTCE